MNIFRIKLVFLIVMILMNIQCSDANINKNSSNVSYASYSKDSDADGLSDEREGWWLCNPMNEDTNADGILDGDSVNFFSNNKTWPYRDLDRNNDTDNDGLPNLAEMYDIGTDFRSFSTDRDPYGDGEEYFNMNMPKISPANHPLVAAYPDLSVRLTQITVTPIETIESTTGGSKQKAWGLSYETSDSKMNSDEAGVAVTVKAEVEFGVPQSGGKAGVEVSGHYAHVWEKTHTTTGGSSSSGWDQNDWSTAHTSNSAEAAKLGFTLNVKNSGTVPAEEINPDVNIKLGKKIIATITSPTTISSIDSGDTSNNFLIDQDMVGGIPNGITTTLEQLRLIDAGTPLNIETLQVRAKIKKWDGNKNEWVLMDRDVSTYMNEINRISATLMFDLSDGSYKEYKVFANSENSPMTLGKAINLTIERDFVPQQADEIWDFGFSEEDAYSEFRNLIEKNESIYNLKLKPGWKIVIKGQQIDKPELKILWTGYSQDMKTIFASILSNLRVESVVAHVNLGDTYQDLIMTDHDEDMVYTLQLGKVLKREQGNYVNVTDIRNHSVTSSIPTRSLADTDFSEGVGTPNQVWHKDSRGIEGWAAINDKFGMYLASGDFNGDGIDDLAESPGNSVSNGITIMPGSVNGLDANNPIVKPESSVSIIAAGDLNDDGIDDLVMQGYKIRYDILNYTGYLDWKPTHYDIGGNLIVEDFNGDGIGDLIIGYTEGETLSSIYIFSLDSKGSNLLRFKDKIELEEIGQTRLYQKGFIPINFAVGDFDSDRKADLAVGVPDCSIDKSGNYTWWEKQPPSPPDQEMGTVGVVVIFYSSSAGYFGSSSGEDYHSTELWQKDRLGLAMVPMDSFGRSLNAGDFNFDGIDDLAVGSVSNENGSVHILFGSERGISNNSVILQPDGCGRSFGEAMAVGDINGDGIEDLIVGEPGNDRVRVFLGPFRGTTTYHPKILSQESLGLNETSENDFFGASLTVGDFNKDGIDDLAVGAPFEDIDISPGKTVVRVCPEMYWDESECSPSTRVTDAGAIYIVYSRKE